jgi:dephospho-CoA kinase
MANLSIQKPAFRVGLTGGIASGKSTVATLFARLGAHIIDADSIARALTQKNHPNTLLIIDHFGRDFVTQEGELDRKKMREHICLYPDANHWLKNLLHPQIHAQLMEQSFVCKSSYCILMIPLLAESMHNYQLDRICMVDCFESLQLERLKTRDHVSLQEAERFLSMQASRDSRLAIADDIILNNGDLVYLEKQVQDLHSWYLALSHDQTS